MMQAAMKGVEAAGAIWQAVQARLLEVACARVDPWRGRLRNDDHIVDSPVDMGDLARTMLLCDHARVAR